MGFRVGPGVLEKMSYSPRFMMSPSCADVFTSEAGKPAHGVAHVACLACCSLQIVKLFLLLYIFFWVFPRRPIVVCRRFGTLFVTLPCLML